MAVRVYKATWWRHADVLQRGGPQKGTRTVTMREFRERHDQQSLPAAHFPASNEAGRFLGGGAISAPALLFPWFCSSLPSCESPRPLAFEFRRASVFLRLR